MEALDRLCSSVKRESDAFAKLYYTETRRSESQRKQKIIGYPTLLVSASYSVLLDADSGVPLSLILPNCRLFISFYSLRTRRTSSYGLPGYLSILYSEYSIFMGFRVTLVFSIYGGFSSAASLGTKTKVCSPLHSSDILDKGEYELIQLLGAAADLAVGRNQSRNMRC